MAEIDISDYVLNWMFSWKQFLISLELKNFVTRMFASLRSFQLQKISQFLMKADTQADSQDS